MLDDGNDDGDAPPAATIPAPLRPVGLLRSIAHHVGGDAVALPIEGHLPSFDGATGWLGAEPLTPEGLRGRVVLVDFWTYTCINWLRTLPYLRAWDQKYGPHGLTVVGVHTPEFGFEHNVENVIAAARDMRIEYSVALDNDYAIWRAFSNHFWPALYIADAQGRIRYHHFGEGEYAQSEMVLQQLLVETGAGGFDGDLVNVQGRGTEAPADWESLGTPETYLGHGRAEGFASPHPPRFDRPHAYPVPSPLRLNQWAPWGTWTIRQHAAALDESDGGIAFRFRARDLHLVMGPATPGRSVPFRVTIDGAAPGDAHGLDVDDQGNGTLAEQRLHQLIRQPGPIADRLFEIEFHGSGVEAYSFTFG